jgi:uncharacterized protein
MTYTAIAAGSLGLLLALLGIAVSLHRITGRDKVEHFPKLQRIHGNAAEHIPIMLVLILCTEALRAPRWVLLAAVITAIVARVVHAIGYFIRRVHPLHFLGSSLTYTVEAGLGLYVLVVGLQRL